MSGEWNACETVRALVLMPSAVRRAEISATAAPAPEITICPGALTAAMATMSRAPSMAACTRASSAMTDVITPPAGSACIRRPRAAISLRPSSSDTPPATHMAAISPTLWPITTSGATPHDCHRAASAYSKAKSAGWV